MLLDSAKLQEEEAFYASKKGYSKHNPPEPLYDEKDTQKVFPLLISHPFRQWIKISDTIEIRFQTAGHILGASIIEVLLKGEKENKKIVFSGDLGRYQDPLMPPPTPIQEADILLVESTYGNRDSIDVFPEKELGRIVRQTLRNGCLIIPAFSVGRTQSVLYYLTQLLEKQEIPNAPIFVDSPMAIDVTELYDKYDDCHSLVKEVFQQEPNFLKHPNIHYYQSQEQSISLNEIRKGAIIISASGMATGGRILHHLYNRLPNSQDAILFVGYQSEGTRGRDLLEGKEFIKIFGSYVPVKAHVEYIAGLSAHADQEELLQWISNFKQSPKITFIIHGEKKPLRPLPT